jgi:hypothetical protein
MARMEKMGSDLWIGILAPARNKITTGNDRLMDGGVLLTSLAGNFK